MKGDLPNVCKILHMHIYTLCQWYIVLQLVLILFCYTGTEYLKSHHKKYQLSICLCNLKGVIKSFGFIILWEIVV